MIIKSYKQFGGNKNNLLRFSSFQKKKHFIISQTRIDKNFCYRGASAQFFFTLGNFFPKKEL